MNMNSTEVEAWIKKFIVSKRLIDRKIKKKKIEKPVEIIISPSTIHLPLIKEASKRGLRVLIFGAKGNEQIRRVKEAGAGGFITDDIASLKEAMEKIKQNPA